MSIEDFFINIKTKEVQDFFIKKIIIIIVIKVMLIKKQNMNFYFH